MKINWFDIPDSVFEQIVAALLRAMGYENVIVRTGGSDDGWDIDAQTSQTVQDGTLETKTWRVECKRYRNNPPAEKIRDHYIRMANATPIPDYVLFVTTGALTNPTKRDLKEFAEKDRVGVRWWEGQELLNHVQKYLSDSSLRSLIAPYVELALSRLSLREICKQQVHTEIRMRVGPKYLPHLSYSRPIETDIERFIEIDLESVQLNELSQVLRQLKIRELSSSAFDVWSEALEKLGSSSSRENAEPHLQLIIECVNDKMKDTVKQIINSILSIRRNCFLIKDKAGSGKTNSLCRLATRERSSSLAIFLSCKFDLPGSRSLEEIIAGALQAALPRQNEKDKELQLPPDSPRDFMEAVVLTLQQSKDQLVIFLDGINENRDLAALDEAIINLLARYNSAPIKFVITCRDIFWSFFRQDHWASFLFDNKAHDLPGFEEDQVDEVIDAYFRNFGINGRLSGAAREKCRHPLLLRFFCEAYRDQDIREYEDLRLKDLFDKYWLRKRQEIAEALLLGSDGGRKVEAFLFKILDYMSERYATQIPLGQVPVLTGEQDMESDRSLYKHLLDQDIIIEEMPPANAFDRSYHARRISFVYDEFYDYMMALNHIRKSDWDSRDAKHICLDLLKLIRRSTDFEQLRGVAEYLVLITEQKDMHRTLCATLSRLGNYEILCNVLPKLKGETGWMSDILRICLLSTANANHTQVVPALKEATGWWPTPDVVEDLILKAEPDDLYNVLLKGE